MHEPHPGQPRSFDTDTAILLGRQYADAELRVNGVRIAVLGVLAIAATVYAPYLSPQLSLTNFVVLAPMLAWAIGQHLFAHRTGRATGGLIHANIILDITATTLLLLGYGVFGEPNLAVKSPIFSVYFVVLATRPFTGSPRRAALAAVLASAQYAGLVTYLLSSGRLQLLDDPMRSGMTAGTSLLDEGSKVMMLIVAGVVSTYATAWIESTLVKGISARRNADARFRSVFEQTGVGVALLSESSTIIEGNEALAAFLGTTAERLVGEPLHGYSHPDEQDVVDGMERDVVAGERGSVSGEHRYVRNDGEVVWGSLTLTRAPDDSG
ncbi:MAG: PAS domain S-box protein, partial [Gemmatimonadota bacterium]